MKNTEKIESHASSSHNKLDEFNNALSDMVSKIEQIKRDNSYVSYELFTNMAKLDHMIYKNNAYSSVLECKSNGQLIDHTTCNLGKWYASTGKEIFGHSSSYALVDKPHKTVHDNVTKVMKLVESGSIENSTEIIECFNRAEEASKELCI